MIVELQLDENILVVGDVIRSDGSFDHAFGTEPGTEYEVEDLQVYVWICGEDYDVIDLLKKDDIDNIKDRLINQVLENPC